VAYTGARLCYGQSRGCRRLQLCCSSVAAEAPSHRQSRSCRAATSCTSLRKYPAATAQEKRLVKRQSPSQALQTAPVAALLHLCCSSVAASKVPGPRGFSDGASATDRLHVVACDAGAQRQYLYFCASKASKATGKLSACICAAYASLPLAASADICTFVPVNK
jgi:hypothetical protein